MPTSSVLYTQAIHEVGVLDTPLDRLVAALKACSYDAWIYRTDRESDKTCVIRAGSPAWGPLAENIATLLQEVETRFFPPGYTNRVLLSCVPAGEQILPHTDDFGSEVQRTSVHCHIPIQTHPDVVMGYGENNTEVHMQGGHLYILDATKRHYVRNPTTIDRVHLLFAYFPHKTEDLQKCYGAWMLHELS